MMCGFVGVFSAGGTPDDNLSDAASVLLSRGPDMQGVNSGSNWKVAFNRLSINDLSLNGMQPFSFEGVTVFSNGEIYNWKELKEAHKGEYSCVSGSDAEILPFLYKKYGIDFLNMLEGMFALVIIDEARGVNYLARDRYGEKPLYYHFKNNRLYFASEVKAIKEIVPLEVDPVNMRINLSCWHLPQPLTLYKSTFKVESGSYVEFDHDGYRQCIWYKPNIKVCHDDEETIKTRFLELFGSAVRRQLRSDVDVGVFLSGGMDSISIARFASEFEPSGFRAFGAEIVDKDKTKAPNTDIVIPSRVSDDFGLLYQKRRVDFDYYNNNIISIIKGYDELFINSGVLLFYALSGLAQKEGVKVIFTGVGGDELFGGYPWQSGLMRRLQPFFNLLCNKLPYNDYVYTFLIKISKPISIAYKMLSDFEVWRSQSLSIGYFNRFFKKDRVEPESRLREYSTNKSGVIRKEVSGDIFNYVGYTSVYSILNGQTFLCDAACMRYSVENRSPFLDSALFEYMISIPDKAKVKNGHKGLLRKIMSKHLPSYVLTAKKSGPGMPVETWIFDQLGIEPVRKFIMNNARLIKEYVSVDLFHGIVSANDNFYSRNNSLVIFALISTVIWIKVNVIGEDIENAKLSEYLESC